MEDLSYLEELGLITDQGYQSPIKEPFKIVNNGVIFQKYCKNGLPYDIAVSWLQKSIRRGLLDQSLYCAYHIMQLDLDDDGVVVRRIFTSHLLNRLIIVLSEDIGPAEPALPIEIERMYTEVYADRSDLQRVQRNVIAMIGLLVAAKKSRITDLLIHKNEDNKDDEDDEDEEDEDEDDDGIDLVDDIHYLTRWAIRATRRARKTRVAFHYKYNGVNYYKEKQLEVYHIWALILEYAQDDDCYDSIVSLLELYQARGAKAGLLHLIHALTLILFRLPDTWMDLESYDKHNPGYIKIFQCKVKLHGLAGMAWKAWKYPIMNSAVDMHTYYGRKYLGRSHYDFFKYGANLANFHPFPDEERLNEEFVKKYQQSISPVSPYPYQSNLIDNAVSQMRIFKAGWLIMPCGTGKTKSAYWIMQKLLEMQQSYLVVIVVPFLEILRQFFQSWSQLNRQYGTRSISGIMASCYDSFSKDDNTNYEYLTGTTTIKRFLGYKCPHKFIYTTYSSIIKIINSGLIKPDLTVYDEAHHIKSAKLFPDGQKLYLTATPPFDYNLYAPLIGKYRFIDAINDGNLVDYRVIIVGCISIIKFLDLIMEKCSKPIVYSSTNRIAQELQQCYIDNGNDNCYYMNCKTSMAERKRILQKYKDDERAIIFNCAILGEGVDFTHCDGIFLQSGYTSYNRVIQAMGRALRLHQGKSMAYIFMTTDKNVGKRLNIIEQIDPNVRNKIRYVTV
jgi:superfamily II DNA or RNA helicase